MHIEVLEDNIDFKKIIAEANTIKVSLKKGWTNIGHVGLQGHTPKLYPLEEYKSSIGKSTTLRIAAGLEQQDYGKVKINGNLISEPNVCHLPPEKRNIGFMFQDLALFPHLNVKKNIEFGFTNKQSI